MLISLPVAVEVSWTQLRCVCVCVGGSIADVQTHAASEGLNSDFYRLSVGKCSAMNILSSLQRKSTFCHWRRWLYIAISLNRRCCMMSFCRDIRKGCAGHKPYASVRDTKRYLGRLDKTRGPNGKMPVCDGLQWERVTQDRQTCNRCCVFIKFHLYFLKYIFISTHLWKWHTEHHVPKAPYYCLSTQKYAEC